jgi:hypothetical protein
MSMSTVGIRPYCTMDVTICLTLVTFRKFKKCSPSMCCCKMTGLHLQHYSHFLQTTPVYLFTHWAHRHSIGSQFWGSENAFIANQFTSLLPELVQEDGTLHRMKLWIQHTARVNHISKLLRLSTDMLYYINTNNLDNVWYITGDQNRHWRVTWRYRTPQDNGMENTGRVHLGTFG